MHSGKLLILIYLLISAFSLPASGQYDFTVDNTAGCTPMKVKYTFINTATVDSVISYNWDLGPGEFYNTNAPDTVTYEEPGIINPTLVLTFINGFELWISKPALITVHRTVPANFNITNSVSYNYYVFEHVEPLDTNLTYIWDIEEFPPRDSTESRQEVIFPRADTFTVVLTVEDKFGCSSTVSRDINVFEEISVQNVFTPNGDNTNEEFIITSNGGVPIKLQIFSRAGILVYAAEGTTVTWDGRTASGLELKPGIYYYNIDALAGDPDKRYSKTGFLYMYK